MHSTSTPERGAVRGKVVDEAGRPVAKAEVEGT